MPSAANAIESPILPLDFTSFSLFIAGFFNRLDKTLAQGNGTIQRQSHQRLSMQKAVRNSRALALVHRYSDQFVLPGAAEADALGAAGFCPPVNCSITERTASRVLRSLTASSRGAAAGARRIRLSGSGKISGSSHGPCTTKGRSNPGAPLVPETRLATPLRSYSRPGTEVVPVSVTRVFGPSIRTSSAVAMPLLNFTETLRLS